MDDYETPMSVRLIFCAVLFGAIVGTHYLYCDVLTALSTGLIKAEQTKEGGYPGALTTWKIFSDFFAGGKIQTVWVAYYLMFWS